MSSQFIVELRTKSSAMAVIKAGSQVEAKLKAERLAFDGVLNAMQSDIDEEFVNDRNRADSEDVVAVHYLHQQTAVSNADGSDLVEGARI